MKMILAAFLVFFSVSAHANMGMTSTCKVLEITDSSVFGADLDVATNNQVKITVNAANDFSVVVGARSFSSAAGDVLESDVVAPPGASIHFVMVSEKANPANKYMFMIPTDGQTMTSAIGFFNLDRGVETYAATLECK